MPAHTTLEIIPNANDKTAALIGEIAVGELVRVIVRDAGAPEGLRVRIRFAQRDIAVFPLAENDVWESDGEGAYSGTLNMNTVEGRKLFESKPDISVLHCICIVDVPVNESLTLTVAEKIAVHNWALADDDAPELVTLGNFARRFAEHAHTGADGSSQIDHGFLLNRGTLTHDELEAALAEQTALVAALQSTVSTLSTLVHSLAAAFDAHAANTDNPHAVTAAQTAALTQPQADALYIRMDEIPVRRRFRKYENPNEVVDLIMFDQSPFVGDALDATTAQE